MIGLQHQLFMTIKKTNVEHIFRRQLLFQETIGVPTEFLSTFDRVKASNIQLRRAIDELHEALVEMPYDLSGYSKSKKLLSFDFTNVIDEIVDAQLFIINALNVLQINPTTFLDQCSKKQVINIDRFKGKKRFRQEQDNFLIVIEGMDGVGKSTICEELSRRTGYPILRMPDIPTTNMEEYAHFYRRMVANLDGVYILDRFYPSSMVYGEFFQRNVPLDDVKTLHEKKEVFVFVIDRETPYRADETITEKHWPLLRNIYLDKAKQHKWKIINNDSTLNNCVQEILEGLAY